MRYKSVFPKKIIAAQNDEALANQIAEEVGPRLKDIVITAATKPLNRYSVREGHIFGKPQSKERFKVIRISGNQIVYKNLLTDRVEYEHIDSLLEKWDLANIKEITPVNSILSLIKKYLTPFLGTVLVGALIAWLLRKLG